MADLYRRDGVASNRSYRWNQNLPEAGKKQLAGDTVREATTLDTLKSPRHPAPPGTCRNVPTQTSC